MVIDVASRTLALDVPEEVLAERRAKVDASERPWHPRIATGRSRRHCAPTRHWRRARSTGAVRRVL